MKKLLFEIGTEELPANYMPNILKDLKALALKKLQDARVPFTDVTVMGTPRRLAVLVSGVEETQADSTEEFKGPAVSIAYKDGEPVGRIAAIINNGHLKRYNDGVGFFGY